MNDKTDFESAGKISRAKQFLDLIEGRVFRILKILIAAALIAAGGWFAIDSYRFASSAHSASGQAIFINEKGKRGKMYYRIAFESQLPRGSERDELLLENIRREGYSTKDGKFIFTAANPLIGALFADEVPVLYNLKNPNEAKVNTFTSLYSETLILLSISLILLLPSKKRKGHL